MSKRTKATTPLTINGHTITPDNNGNYPVHSVTLGKWNLALLPAGTKLYLWHPSRRINHIDEVYIEFIEILPRHKAVVDGQVWYVGAWWNHAMDLSKCTRIARAQLRATATGRSDFTFVGQIAEDDWISLLFRQTVDAGPFGAIRRQVRDVVVTALQPLLDFRREVDDECMGMFGI